MRLELRPQIDIEFTEIIEKEESMEFKERMLEVVNACIENMTHEHVSLGEGKAAEVYYRNANSTACIKFNINNDISPNSLEEEQDIMVKLYLAGIRVPKPIGLVRGTRELLIMEKINGSSLEDFINNENQTELPDDFDLNVFFDKCEEELKKMHELGYHHRDLHLGNIMIDSEGKPIFIDFGDAKKQFLSGEDIYVDHTVKGIVRYTSDKDRLKQGKMRFFNEYLNNKDPQFNK